MTVNAICETRDRVTCVRDNLVTLGDTVARKLEQINKRAGQHEQRITRLEEKGQGDTTALKVSAVAGTFGGLCVLGAAVPASAPIVFPIAGAMMFGAGAFVVYKTGEAAAYVFGQLCSRNAPKQA